MLGLIKKEILVYFGNQRRYVYLGDLATFIVCLLLGNTMGLALYVLLIMPMAASTLPVSLFEADGKANFDRYAISLPVRKLQIVGARFLFQFLFISVYACLMLVFTLLYARIYQSLSYSDYLMLLYVGILLMLIMSFVNLAGSYMLGFQGGAILLACFYFLMIGTASLFALLSKKGTFDILAYLLAHPNFIWILLSGVMLLIILASFALACISFQWKHR